MSVFSQINKAIKEHQTIIIHRHQRPDPDALGSQFGLKTILEHAFPEKNIYAVGNDVPSLNWIGMSDNIGDTVFDDTLVMVLDTANPPRIDDRRFNLGQQIIKIDHHPNVDEYGDIMWVDPQFSSTSEMIIELTENIEELALNVEAARTLYAGIVGDTGRFMYSTHASTLQRAARLYQFDFHPEKVNQHMNSVTLNQLKFAGKIESELEVEDKMASVILSLEQIEIANLGDAGTEFTVSIPGRVDQVIVWAIFEEQNDHSYRVRIRSKGPKISDVATRHNGGGHDQASGAKAKNINEVKTIIEELKQVAQRG